MSAIRRRFLSALLAWALLAAPLTAADQIIEPTRTELTVGQPLVLHLGTNPYAEQDCGLLLFDAYSHLVGASWLPPPVPPDPDADVIPFSPISEFWFRTDDLTPGPLTVKFGCRETVDGVVRFNVHQSCTVTLKPADNPALPAAAAALSPWTPRHPVQFWRSTPLAVDTKNDWEKLLADCRLTGADAPGDGPVLVLPRGTILSSRMIAAEIEPLLAQRGLVLCETWPTPSLDDAVDLSTIVSPTAPVVKLPDIRPIQALTGLAGPAIPSDPDPAEWLDRDRQARLLARRDPAHHRLYGLVEASFCVLTTHLKPAVSTQVLRYAADGSPAVTLRTLPYGGAVVVLNAAVDGYAAQSVKTAAAVDFLGVDSAYARQLLAGVHGGAALRDALGQVRSILESRRAEIGEIGPYYRLRPELHPFEDRYLFIVAELQPTRRTLATWTPPAGIAVRLSRNGEPQQQMVMALHDNQYFQSFRIPLDAPADGWQITYDDPFSGQTVTLPVPLPATLDLTVIDAPAP